MKSIKKSLTSSSFLYKKLFQYSQKNNVSPGTLFLALLHIFVYKINGIKETIVKIENKKNSRKKGLIASRISVDSSLKTSDFIKCLSVKETSENLSFFISLPYFSENANNQIHMIDNNSKESSSNYKIDFSYSKKGINFILESCSDSKIKVEKYLNEFSNFLNNFVTKENVKIKDLELISPQEKKKLVDNFNNLDCRKPKYANIFSYFEELALKKGNKVIIECKDKKIIYREVLQKACYINNLISKQTKKKQGIIVNFLPKEPDLVFAFLGVLRSENISIMIRPNYPKERIKAIFKTVCPDIIITKTKYKKHVELLISEAGIFKKINILLIDKIDSEFAGVKITKFIKPKGEYNFLSNIIFTSGSTGQQKAIVMTHKIVSSYLSYGAYDVTESNDEFRLMSFFTVEFTGFFRELLLTVFRGNALCFLPDENIKLDARLLVDWVEKNDISYLCIIADIFEKIKKYAQKPKRLDKLKHLFLILGRISNDEYLHRFVMNHPNLTVRKAYGMSEMGLVRSDCKIISKIFQKLNIPDLNIYKSNHLRAIVLNQDGNVQPVGFVGEAYIHSPFIAAGYYNNKELTKERFIQNPFSRKKNDIILRTGDFFRILEDGDLEYLGRNDDQLSIRGVKIFTHDIESYMLQYPSVKECIAVIKETKKEGIFTAVFYTGRNEIDVSLIRNHLKNWLPEYSMPKYFVFIESFPLLPSKKIDKKKLLKIPLGNKMLEDCQNFRNDLEKIIQSIWQEVLKIKKIGINENFFNIGGDSLNIMKVYYRINSLYPGKIKSSEVFLNPTINKMAKVIEKKMKNTN